MSILHAIVLGIVQGLTEFLPVSSSGHLVVVPELLGWKSGGVTFDLVLHLGTLVAVVGYFWYDLWGLFIGLFGKGPDPARSRRVVVLLALATVPAGLAGYFFTDFFAEQFEKPGLVTLFWFVTAMILVLAELLHKRQLNQRAAEIVQVHDVSTPSALVMGVLQAVSIFPGISRSGSTIAAGMASGATREQAARFSFLMSIPIIAGAIASKLPDVADGSFKLTAAVTAGFVASLVVGFISIAWLLRLLRTHSLYWFAVYLAVVSPASAMFLAFKN